MDTQNKRENIIQNLRDTGCSEGFLTSFLDVYDQGKKQQQVDLLEHWRKEILERIHRQERQISCLDFLLYRIEKES